MISIPKMLKDNRGQMTISFNWFLIIIVSFMAILLFAGLIYAMGLITSALNQVGAQNDLNAGTCVNYNQATCPASCTWSGATNQCVTPGWSNYTVAANETFGQANSSIQSLRLVALTLIFSLFLATILINFVIKIHPAYFFIYILVVVLAIIFSAPVSNAYQTLLTSDIYGGNLLPSFTGANFFMINLPVVVAVGGVLGGIFLFINIIRGPGEGGLR